MTAQLTAPAVVTPLSTDDIKRVARHLYSLEVQGSRLDLMQYDTDKRQQKHWFEQAHELVRNVEASGRNVTIQD